MSKQVYIMIPRSVNKTDILRTIDESKYFHYCECIPQDKQDAQIYNIYSDEEVCAIGAPSSVFMTGEKLTQTLKQSDILRNHYSKYTPRQQEFIENLRLGQQKRFYQDALQWYSLIEKLIKELHISTVKLYWCYSSKCDILDNYIIYFSNLNPKSFFALKPNTLLTILE